MLRALLFLYLLHKKPKVDSKSAILLCFFTATVYTVFVVLLL